MDNDYNNRCEWHRLLYALPIYFIVSNYVFAVNNDTIIVDGGKLNFENLTLVNDTSGAFIIQAKNGAEFNASQLFLTSTSTRGGGAWIDGSVFRGNNLTINVSGKSASGIYLANSSSAVLNNINIAGQNSAQGLILDGTWSSTQSSATAQVSDSTIATESGDAIHIMAGDLMLTNTVATTTGDSSYAVNVNQAAIATIEGGRYATQGKYSDAVWVTSAGSSVNINNATITTAGERAIALNAQRGTATITNSTLETAGVNGYALYTEKQLTGDELIITTQGRGGTGMFAASGGQAKLTNSGIVTNGELAAGLLAYPGSTIIADNVRVETTGKQGFGLWSRAGQLDVSNSIINTAGDAAAGLYVNGYSTTLSNRVSLDNVTLQSSQAQAIKVDTTTLALSINDSTLSGGNGQVMTVGHYEDAVDPANNLYSNVTLTATNSQLNGDIISTDVGNSVAINLAASELNGAANNVTSLALDSTSRWNMNGSSVVGQLTNNGMIAFSNLNAFDTLTVTGNYAGNDGMLVLNSVLGDDGSPVNKLIVGGDVLAGTTRVAINNLGGHGAQTVEGIEIVDVGGTSYGSFAQSGRIVAGAYDYSLEQKGENWYLTSQPTAVEPELTPEPTAEPTLEPTAEPTLEPAAEPTLEPAAEPTLEPGVKSTEKPSVVRPEAGSYTANLAAANTLFAMSLHDRLGEPSFVDALSAQPEVTSLWLRQIGGHNVWRDGSDQLRTQSNRYVTQLGGDLARWSSDGTDRWHVGFMAGYGNNHNSTRSLMSGLRSTGSVNGYSVGGYATWYARPQESQGAWVDSWLLYNWFNNSVQGEGLASESYKSKGFTASLEAGYTHKLSEFRGSKGSLNEWFIQPQAQAIWMGVKADDFHEANGTRIHGDGDGNIRTRLGIRTFLKGHHAMDNGKARVFQPFAEINWIHNTRDFGTQMDDVNIYQTGARNMGEIKTGVEGLINPRLNIWGNVGVQIGNKGYHDAIAMAGFKYHF
ncbi:MAG: autotransporter outer rane beta-barrel protein [Proteobacteria bacterium]|nr:autotransporter outer rane beta-barrel protein [Pseudomonadota bacterium]